MAKFQNIFMRYYNIDIGKLKKFEKNLPIFKVDFSKSEIEKYVKSNSSNAYSPSNWYHTFQFNDFLIKNARTSLPYQMWNAQGIPNDLSGKTVLDIGAADGFYSFLCESRGAKKVIALDFIEFEGFKIAKKLLNSNVRHQILNLDEINTLTETFDIILFFGIYYHLANPVLALQKIFPIVNDSLFLSGHIIDHPEPIMCYYDEFEMHPSDSSNWWIASPSCITQIAKRVGFKDSTVLDTLRFPSKIQPKSSKKGIRRIKKMGTFRLSKI